MKPGSVVRALAVILGISLSGAGKAAAPEAYGMIGGSFFDFAFVNYTDSTKVGAGLVDQNKLFFFEEQTIGNVQSWYIFFDPTCVSSVDALITFSSNITGVDRKKSQLEVSDATFGKAPDYTAVYETRKFTGLEKRDTAIARANQLEIHWRAGDPGDHIRVYTVATPVPEPQTVALMLLGLCLVGSAAVRRRQTATA